MAPRTGDGEMMFQKKKKSRDKKKKAEKKKDRDRLSYLLNKQSSGKKLTKQEKMEIKDLQNKK
jgi:hypothetical protein